MDGTSGCLDCNCCEVSKEMRRGHRQRLYADSCGRMVKMAMERLIVNVRLFVKFEQMMSW